MADVLGFNAAGAKRVVDGIRKIERMGNLPAAPPPAAPPVQPRWTAKGVAMTAIPYRDYGAVNLWTRNAAGDQADTGQQVAVTVWCIPEGKQIKEGDEVVLNWIDGEWVAVQSETCAEDIP